MFDIETAIIGAGPYGLSLAAHLRARSLPFVIFGKPMESWRSFMPAGMILKSEPMASSLWDPDGAHSLGQFSRDRQHVYQRCGAPLSLKYFLGYADWFQRRAVPEICETYVTDLRRGSKGGFALQLADGSMMTSKNVIVATGHIPFRNMPDSLTDLPAELVSHSLDVTDPQKFRGCDVTIVGLGQSALETAALLHEAGARVRVVGRQHEVAWNGLPRPAPRLLDQIKAPDAGLGAGWRSYIYSEFPWAFRKLPAARRFRIFNSSWGPSGAWWLEERVAGKFPILLDRQVEGVRVVDDRVRASIRGAGEHIEIITDHIIAGTGFAVDFNRLSYIEPSLRGCVALLHRAPVLSASFETNVPGLYTIGLMSAPTFGPSLRFMYGAKFAATTVARSIAQRTPRAHRANYPSKVPVIQ